MFAFFQRNLLPALVAFGAAAILTQLDVAVRIEAITLDWRTRLRAKEKPLPPPPNITIVGIDARSLRDIGRWPWPHARHGDFVQLAAEEDPAVIAWDILFTEKASDTGDFVAGIKSGEVPVVLGAVSAKAGIGVAPDANEVRSSRLRPLRHIEGDQGRILTMPEMSLPTAGLAQVADIGFVDTPPGSDGLRRKAPLVVRIGDTVYPTLSLGTLLEFWHASPQQVRIRLGDAVVVETPSKVWRIPIDASGNFAINYRHDVAGYYNFGYSLLFQTLWQKYAKNQAVPVPEIRHRILLVGQVADGLSDLGPTPFSPLSPLVLVHANVIENILSGDFVHLVPAVPLWVVASAIGAIGLALFSKQKLGSQLAFSLGVPIVYCAGATAAWIYHSIDFPLVMPLVGFAACQAYMIGRRMVQEQRAKEQIRGMFGTYLSPTVVTRLIESGEQPKLGGHLGEITAFFSDIQGYSTFSEVLSAEQLVEFLNDYLTACTDIVQAEAGTLDKYIGDAVVAMFGAPVHIPDHAHRACVAAIRIQERLGELRTRWAADGDRWPEGVRNLHTRIGLNSGIATIGNMGSRTRFNYTMTGDNVNLAARMESGAKSWGVYTLATEATRAACVAHAGDRISFRPLGRILVVGRSQPVEIHEVWGMRDAMTADDAKCLEEFAQGLTAFEQRNWAAAMAAFSRSGELERYQPGRVPLIRTNPSLVFRALAKRYAESPPAADWNGVYVMTDK